jgi:hypothetical protein
VGGVARRPAEFARDLCVRYHHGYVAQHHTAIRRDESGAFRGGPVVWGRSRSQRCRYPNHEKWPGCHRRYSRGALRPPTTLRRGGRTGGRSPRMPSAWNAGCSEVRGAGGPDSVCQRHVGTADRRPLQRGHPSPAITYACCHRNNTEPSQPLSAALGSSYAQHGMSAGKNARRP